MSWLKRRLCGAKNSTPLRHESGDNDDIVNKKNIVFGPDNVTLNKRNKNNKYMVKMKNFLKELILFCVFLLAYGVVYKDPPKVSKPPIAYPFFPTNSAVIDFHYGELHEALSLAKKTTSDISFVIYYAPWDAQSQAARKELLIAAEHLQDSVAFVAVNCWQPESDCKGTFTKITRWPVMIIYISLNNAIQYNGPILAPHIISFLKKLMVPIRIAETPSIFDFEEAYVVAEINASPNSVEYSVYYKTAVKYLASEPYGKISFYIKPVKVTKNSLSLYMWDQQRILDIEPSDWKPEILLQWIFNTMRTPVTWISPPEAKSVTLAHKLQTGPTLIMFTPKNPLSLQYDYFMMLQDIAQQYKNCENWLLSYDIEAKRLYHLLEYKKLKSMCHKIEKKVKTSLAQIAVTTTTLPPFLNATSDNRSKPHGKIELNCGLNSNLRLSSICENFKEGQCFEMFPHHEDTFVRTEEVYKKLDVDYMEDHQVYETSMWKSDWDPKSMQNLAKKQKREKCKTFQAAEKVFPEIFVPSDPLNSEDINITNFACSNNSVKFIVMDSLRHYVFAERLGINLSKKKDMSAVVIVDDQLESHYVMDTPITSRNIKLFLQKYNQSALIRSKGSISNTPAKNTPAYHFKMKNDSSSPMIYVDELNSKNFLDVVLNNMRAVVVMYYGKQCAFCNGISYTFLTVARKLSYVDNIKFTRIDGDENILPWEYTMEEYPTILFFPVNQKEETRVFPSGVPITVPNLLAFMLANMDMTMKLRAMYSVCLHTPLQNAKDACLSTLRNEIITLIENTLKTWRKSNKRQRQLVLHNLQQLRYLQMLFAHSPDQFALIQSHFKKIKEHLCEDYNGIGKDEL